MYENQDNNYSMQERRTAPYAVAAMVLGIVSLMASALGLTLVLGILGLVYSNRGLAECRRNPGMYSGESMLMAGKVTSIVGIVLSCIAIAFIVLVILLGIGLVAAGVTDAL